MKPLTPAQRRELRASAHHLDPVVIVGHHGLTPAVQHEIDLALLKHELIKVRVGSDDREARTALLDAICAAADCAAVQHLGKVLVLWRPNPDLKKKAAPAAEERPARKSAIRRNAAPKTGPRAPLDPVRERRRTRGEDSVSGKGRRGAARFAAPEGSPPPSPEAPAARRKSTFTPKTKPKSFSAKPNPRSAWEKKKVDPGEARTPARPRRRRAGS